MTAASVSDAMRALYDGDRARADALLSPDTQLDVFHAAAFGREERLRDLLAGDSELSRASSPDGFTPLHLAAFTDEAGTARLLVDAGADLEALSRHEEVRVRPLGTAAFAGAHRVARLLLEQGADANGAGERGFRPLHAAAQNGDAALVRLLLDHGADAATPADDGRTPRDVARGEAAALLAG